MNAVGYPQLSGVVGRRGHLVDRSALLPSHHLEYHHLARLDELTHEPVVVPYGAGVSVLPTDPLFLLLEGALSDP